MNDPAPRKRTRGPERDSLVLGVVALGFFPASLTLCVVADVVFTFVGIEPPAFVGGTFATLLLLGFVSSIVWIPVGLISLASYNRQMRELARPDQSAAPNDS